MNKKSARNMNVESLRPRTLVIALAAALPLLAAQPAHAAAFDIANVPLYIGGSLEPNLMYIHDDSGSMFWSFLPDGLGKNYVRGTSSTVNRQYYNPSVTYAAPVDENGDSLGNASFTAAWFNGYDLASRASNVVNLSSSFRATWGYAGDWVNNTGEPAFYHSYSPPRPGCPAPGSVNDNDCYVKVVVSGAEQQNFANWYSYYRTRIYSAKAGVSRAFADISGGIRIGYGRINKGWNSTIDGVTVPVLQRGVRAFTGTARKEFYDWLFAAPADGSTPLRRALNAAGRYYENDNAIGPWSTTPGVSGGTHLSCRKSFTILMTDGYWNGSFSGLGNVDNTAGPSNSGPGGESFTYSAVSPFSDTHSNTLADVAMHYWKRDLSSLANRVPTTATNPAFWQHMVTMPITFGLTGTIAKGTAFDAIDTGATITWPAPTTNPGKADDVLHAAVNSRGDLFSANNPQQFEEELKKALAAVNATTSSASSVSVSSPRMSTDSMVYQAIFNSGDWTGQFFGFKVDPVAKKIITPAAWDASDKIPAHAARTILTWRPAPETTPARGADFDSTDLSVTQKAWLNDSTDLINYLRGDDSKEGSGSTDFRTRQRKLGDIVNSSSAYVGTQNYGYANADGLSAAERNAYRTRRESSTFNNRIQMVYVGANDGMLHGFDGKTGVERVAYVPNVLFKDGHLAELSKRSYTHRYYVDGSPHVSDAWINSSWRSVLVGSTGAGGRAYFALDVEDPSSFSKTNVLWEFEHAELGYTIGKATVARTESGKWVAIFGNGYNSDSHKAQLFVVDMATGALLANIDTAVGSVTDPNGLASPLVIDIDQNGNADFVYAGDMHGNLWKFDLTSNNEGQWSVAFKSGSTVKPLFKTLGPNGERQPITSAPEARLNPDDGGVIVYFGTGQFFEVGDQGVVNQTQSVYGIKDTCGEKTSGSCASASGVAKVVRSNLRQQVIYFEDYDVPFSDSNGTTFKHDVRLVTNHEVADTEGGFYLDLVSPVNGQEGERVVVAPTIFDDRVRFITMTPDPDPCSAGGWSWFIELDPFNGGRTEFSPFDLNNDGKFSSDEFLGGGASGVPVSGRRNPGGIVTGTGSMGDKDFYGDSGAEGPKDDPNNKSAQFLRQSWRQIR
jgi:type IV pilus assembly protein PilY1